MTEEEYRKRIIEDRCALAKAWLDTVTLTIGVPASVVKTAVTFTYDDGATLILEGSDMEEVK